MSNQQNNTGEGKYFTKEKYDLIKRLAEENGYKVITKYRKNLKAIKLAKIDL